MCFIFANDQINIKFSMVVFFLFWRDYYSEKAAGAERGNRSCIVNTHFISSAQKGEMRAVIHLMQMFWYCTVSHALITWRAVLKWRSLFWLQDVADASLQLQRRRSSPVRSVQVGYTVHRAVSRRAGAHVARRHRGEDAGCPDPFYASTGVALIPCVRL